MGMVGRIACGAGLLALLWGCAPRGGGPPPPTRPGAPLAFALLQPNHAAAPHGQVTFLAEPGGVRVRAHLERLAQGEHVLRAEGTGDAWMTLRANADGLCRTDAVLRGRPAPEVGAWLALQRGATGEVVARGRVQAAGRP